MLEDLPSGFTSRSNTPKAGAAVNMEKVRGAQQSAWPVSQTQGEGVNLKCDMFHNEIKYTLTSSSLLTLKKHILVSKV